MEIAARYYEIEERSKTDGADPRDASAANASSARDQRLYRYAKRLGGYLEKLHRPPEPLYEGEVRLEGGR